MPKLSRQSPVERVEVRSISARGRYYVVLVYLCKENFRGFINLYAIYSLSLWLFNAFYMVNTFIDKLRNIVEGFDLVRDCYHGMKTEDTRLTEAQEWLHLELKDCTSAAESSLYRETFFAVKEFFESATDDEIPDEYKELIDALRENYKEYLSIERKDLRITSFSQKGHERNRYF